MLKRPDHGFRINDRVPYGWVNECVFSWDGHIVTRWIMGLRGRVNGRRTLCRSVMITFREHPELQELSGNTAPRSAIVHRVETNGSNQLDHSWKWIAAGDGL